ncbi:hemagglutinin-related protein [Escherichia coli]|nr:hemagglutinin-related protein [Escherichia coli]
MNYHTFSNSGTLLGTSGLGVKGSSLLQNGTGRLYSAGNLLLDAQDFSGQGQVVATGDVTLKLIAALTNQQGKPFPSRRKMPLPTAVSCRVMPWCSVPERHSPTMER